MGSLQKKMFSTRIIYLMLSIILLAATSPIIYYGYQDYSIRAELNNIENPNSLLANRYILTGDWPASKDDSRIITEASKFKVVVSEEHKTKGNELNDK